MCIRCRDAEASGSLVLCEACAAQTRVELAEGYRRLTQYLAAWAAFDDWLRAHEAGPA
jgi:hypothetical protein